MTVDVKVFLNRAEDLFSRFGGGETTYQDGDELEHVLTLNVDVSEVQVDGGAAVLNRAYAMTNRGSDTFVGDEVYPQRSLSVGDVLEVLGSRFAVAGFGFTRLGDAHLTVEVDLPNDAGDHRTLVASGATVDEAVADAERRAGGTYVMNDWRAA